MLKFKQNPYYKQRCYLERIEELPHGIKYEGLDPYILGLWLGDGTKGAPEFESMDQEVIQYLEEYALTHDLRCSYRYRKDSKSMTIRLSSINNKKAGQCSKNALTEDLRQLNVYENKHIPKEFLNYDVNTRLQLLAGLIDTDGSIYYGKGRRGGYMEFTQCEGRKQLVDMFVLIARSLGFKVGVKWVDSKISKIHNNKKITIAQPFYKVRIFDGKYIIPTKIRRKQFTWPTKRVFNSNYAHFDMEFAGRGSYYGFSLEGDKHEFVLGDMTIAHNCIPGREGGKPATFNQITSLDLTMSNVIAEYI
jgi:replicative DNA helicase